MEDKLRIAQSNNLAEIFEMENAPKKPLPVLKFRPFRIVNGEVIVTDYLAWNKVRTHTRKGGEVALFSPLDIVLNMQCKNHKGDNLWWFKENSFIEKPIIKYSPTWFNHPLYDCNGTPAFSHITTERIAGKESHLYEPLMTATVVFEFNKMVALAKTKFVKLIN